MPSLPLALVPDYSLKKKKSIKEEKVKKYFLSKFF